MHTCAFIHTHRRRYRRLNMHTPTHSPTLTYDACMLNTLTHACTHTYASTCMPCSRVVRQRRSAPEESQVRDPMRARAPARFKRLARPSGLAKASLSTLRSLRLPGAPHCLHKSPRAILGRTRTWVAIVPDPLRVFSFMHA
jgi:hypothetical protein